ncbi:MAG TPA: CHAP domain-containing protein [Rhizomicrobium sp.]|nr:CHAP domain-containing protein [Rhizomicrobium sp.]
MVLPLLAGVLAFAPLSAARADVGDDMVSFFGHVATAVKTGVAKLPDQVAKLPDQMAALPHQLGISAGHSAPTETVFVTPRAVLPASATEFKAELADFTPTAVAVPLPVPTVEKSARRLFCAEYARIRTGFPVFGDAKNWWERAKNLYDRATSPVAEAVMVFSTTKRLKKGHVAVVTDIVSPREVRVDQANWLNHGEIDHSTPVLDVSPGNDWSQVRVWDVRSSQFGSHVYPISGFIVKAPVRQASLN